MKWYGILALLFILFALAGIVYIGMNTEKFYGPSRSFSQTSTQFQAKDTSTNNSIIIDHDKNNMIIISYEIFLEKGESIDRFRDAFRIMDEETRKEPGCLMYVSTVDINDPTIIRIYEVWESADALKPHFQTDHIKDFQKALSKLGVKSTNTKAYESNKEIPFESLR